MEDTEKWGSTKGAFSEFSQQFESRKQDHIRLSLDDANEAIGASGLDRIQLCHEALPELDFSEISINTTALGMELETPFLVSSMTAGHPEGMDLNRGMAVACQERGWLMGVGSQRRQLVDLESDQEWKALRAQAPKLRLLGNLGLSQLIRTPIKQVQRLVDSLEASAMVIHTNPLQECLQPEGTPHFKGGLAALTELSRVLSVPVIIKETGCGFGGGTLERLRQTGVQAVDVSGYGGTHWGRIEGRRAEGGSIKSRAARSFWHWGVSTVDSLEIGLAKAAGLGKLPGYEIWASGGLRSGLDGAKVLAMGARVAGFAKPILRAALQGEAQLHLEMEQMEYELKTALFCTGCASIAELQSKGIWSWRQG